MFRILPYMAYFKSLVKILLPVMDLNMDYKTKIASINTCNSDFRKTREIWFSRDIHTPPSSPYVLLYYTTIDHNNLSLPSPALHTVQSKSRQPSRDFPSPYKL